MRPKRTCVNETNERIRIYSEWANSQRQRQPMNNASANSQQTEPTQNQDEEEEENQPLDVTVDNSQQTEPTQEHVDVQDGVHQSIGIQLEQCTPCTVGLEVMSQSDSETQYFNRYRATNTTGSKRRKVIESDDDDDDDDDVVDAHSNVTHTPSLVSPQTSTQSKRVRFDQNNRQQQRPSNSSSHNSPIHQNIQNAGTSSTHNQIEMECQNVFSSMTRIIASNAAHRQIVETIANELSTQLNQFTRNIKLNSNVKQKVEDLVEKFKRSHDEALQRLRNGFGICVDTNTTAASTVADWNDVSTPTSSGDTVASGTRPIQSQSNTSNARQKTIPAKRKKRANTIANAPAPKKRTTRATSMPNTSNNDYVSDDFDFNDGDDDGDNGDEDSERYQSIKMGKRKSFNENLQNKDELASIINKIVTDMSHTWRLGALNVHCSLMRIIQSNNEAAIRTEFWNSTCEYNRNYFDGYFRGVYGNCINGKTKLRKTWKLDQAIIKFCQKHIEKNAIGYGNIFTYATRQYFTNFMMCIIRSLYNNVRAYLNHFVIITN
ncbi:uncharacterized protein LOC116347357 [Contarinia nasturtii]|uniref:uncharacterized protein LOC116347357 n=1 Tax=Contarinia nasturtii TaxID=265458 RepID=UPI0012D4364A|nr:uncharacterized protein LOC116347357 [Contarinia nasturtii]